jgi:hypothetical protein
MTVKRTKILITDNNVSGNTLNIPIRMDFTPIDNSELVQTKFVDDEIEKAINPIVDYKKIIFKPADNNWNIINELEYVFNFFEPTTTPTGTPSPPIPQYVNNYSPLGFLFDDLFCRTPRFINSFLRITLHDTTDTSSNNVLGFIDIYTQIGKNQTDVYGFVLPLDTCPASMVVGDPVLKPETIHEGYNMYWYKDMVDESPNGEYVVYASTSFNNAKNGVSTGIYTTPNLSPLDIQINNINNSTGPYWMKIVFKNDNGEYKYRFEPNNSNFTDGFNLNPTVGIPTITFWQIQP